VVSVVVVVGLVVGVVTSQSRNPPCCHDSAITSKMLAVAAHSVPSNKKVPNAHPTSSSSPSGGPRYSRIKMLTSAAVEAQSVLSTKTSCPEAS
jgi:hypothetical protein